MAKMEQWCFLIILINGRHFGHNLGHDSAGESLSAQKRYSFARSFIFVKRRLEKIECFWILNFWGSITSQDFHKCVLGTCENTQEPFHPFIIKNELEAMRVFWAFKWLTSATPRLVTADLPLRPTKATQVAFGPNVGHNYGQNNSNHYSSFRGLCRFSNICNVKRCSL